jgi:hypothetical protein
MKQSFSLHISILAIIFLFSQPVFSATDCSYFSVSVKVGRPSTRVKSPVKEVTIYWEGVDVTISGNGQLVSSAVSSVNYYYDNKNKRYSSLNHNGHSVRLSYTKSPYNTNQGNIMNISRTPGSVVHFVYDNNNGYLSSISYRGNIMRFYYHPDGSLKHIAQPVPVQCVYATYDGTN